jgi:UDP-N-acetylglucosamine 4,6-dehydratase/5-epimerase
MFAGQTFLITGGTGSFGKTLVEHLLSSDVQKIVVLSRDEAKQHFMREEFPDPRLKLVLGDVRNEQTVRAVLQGVDFVFHAAALKQVPAGESYPWEFVQTNVVGSQNLISNLEAAGVKKAVFLSTDKAVYPVNAMGMSKAMMEKLVRAEHHGATTCPIITRYGNVIGSRGSVIPGFLKSVKETGSVNITDGSMTRFMMSLKESVELVLFALENGKPGDLFVQKAPASTVETLVDAIEIMTKRKITRNYVGIRPGEKIHESLLTEEERARASETADYFQVPRLPHQISTLDSTFEEYSSNSTKMLTPQELAEMLIGIPEIRNLIQEI